MKDRLPGRWERSATVVTNITVRNCDGILLGAHNRQLRTPLFWGMSPREGVTNEK